MYDALIYCKKQDSFSELNFEYVGFSTDDSRQADLSVQLLERSVSEMLKPRGQAGLDAKILASASASGPFGLGLKLLVSASKFNI